MTLLGADTPAMDKCEHTLHVARPRIVLDTNAVLDWFLFADLRARAIVDAVQGGHVHWVVSPSMRDEFVHVLMRGLARARHCDAAPLVAAWDRHARMLPEPPSQPIRCSDPDDQRFIDLAIAAQARWLVSRDKALLRLSRRAAALGLTIVTPQAWAQTAEDAA